MNNVSSTKILDTLFFIYSYIIWVKTWKGGIIMETGKIDKTLSVNSKEMKSLKRIMEIMFQNTNFQKEKDPILFDFQIEINSNFLTSNPSCKKEYYDILAKAKTTFNPKQTPQIKTIIGKHHGHQIQTHFIL